MSQPLLFVTSPREGGNSDDAAQVMMGALVERGCSPELVRLREHRVEHCRGCLNCQRGRPCEIQDDFPDLWARVKSAQTIVYFVPVYWCSPPGGMKDFMDRTVVDYLAGGVMQGKDVYLVSIAQAAGFEPQEEIIDTWVRWLGGSALEAKLQLIAFHTGELAANSGAMEELKELAGLVAGVP